MATKYLLQCKCGQKWPVETRKAGEELACRCGAKLEVPTLRGLQRLPVIESQRTESQRTAAAGWSKQQGLGFLAAVAWIVLGSLATYYFWQDQHQPVEQQRFDVVAEDLTSRLPDLTLSETWTLWRMFHESSDGMLSGPERVRATQAEAKRQGGWTWCAGVATAAGIGWLAWIIVGGKRKPRPTE
ncbi:MAG: hypothetical protein K8T25_05370 [Planctomycetia bacterium]|nr:hypothetical protein [Planctomycetia bacterium]